MADARGSRSNSGSGLLGLFRNGSGGADGADLSPHALASGDELGLSGTTTDYRILGFPGRGADPRRSAGDTRAIDDLGAFRTTCGALADLGCNRAEIRQLFSLLAALLHLGNGQFEDDATGNARAAPGPGAAALEAAGKALACPQVRGPSTDRPLNLHCPSTALPLTFH